MSTCEKCEKTFIHTKKYLSHVNNLLNPCDLVCIGCSYQANSKSSWTRHKRSCKQYQNKEQVMNITNNNVTTAGSHNTNNTNNTLNNNINNNNQIVLLSPYGLEHRMMEKEVEYREQVLGSTRDKILDIVKQQNFTLAYQTLFKHIHGNMDYPEHHNIYIEDRDKDEVCLFTGKQFAYESANQETPGLYRFLMVELKWVVGTADITFKEKDQLLHDIQCHWRLINEETDEDIRRMLFNNKQIVEHTINQNVVRPNTDLIEDYYDFERGTLKSFDMDIHLPK